MKIIGNAQLAADPAVVYEALNDPAVLVAVPSPAASGSRRSATTPTRCRSRPGVGSIKGVYDGRGPAHRPAAVGVVPDARPRARVPRARSRPTCS